MLRRPALTRPAALIAAAVTAAALAPVLTATATAQAAPAALPSVYPVPQSMTASGSAVALGKRVALVTGAGSDASAVRTVRAALTAAGVPSVTTVRTLADAVAGQPAVITDPAQADAALKALKITGPAKLADEGYVVATGRRSGRPVIVLDGKDATGSFYAAQTLRQLLQGHGSAVRVAGVRVRDWPTYDLRGVIEGFYGTPWSDAARLRQFDFYGQHKMNTYVYSPKDDDYLRAKWRDPYPADKLAALKTFVARATANHVEFTYALSPGLSVCYSSAADLQALMTKFQSLWDIGVRTFAIPLDDISYTKWNCTADEQKFGTGGGAAGKAQSYLLNAVQKQFIATHSGSNRLEMVATEYYDLKTSDYKTALSADLDPAIVVEWTGNGVVVPTITKQQSAQAKKLFGHDILVWDNYPVNDYVTDRLLLGPYTGRDPGMSGSLFGLTANPMIQPEASKIAEFTVADFLWNDKAYDETTSWQASLRELAGSDPAARTALAAFADLEHSSKLDPVEAPVLAAKLATFWKGGGKDGSASGDKALRPYLAVLAQVRTTLATYMHDPAFVTDADPWLRSTQAWANAMTAALDMLAAQRADDPSAAQAARARVITWRDRAKAYQYKGLAGTVNVTVGAGVVDSFVAKALTRNGEWLGLPAAPTAVVSPPQYLSNSPDRMVDGDDSTYYYASRPLATGDTIGVDLGRVEPITRVHVTMGKSDTPDDYVHTGVVEVSTDAKTWTQIGTASAATVDVSPRAGTSARYVRLRVTANQTQWGVFREFTVSSPGSTVGTVTGTPAAADGSSLSAAADGLLDTTYTAAAAPAAGDALIDTLAGARTVRRVVVVGTGAATVQVRVNGLWRTLGTTSGRVSRLAAYGVRADAVRLVWRAGSSAPRISEIIPS